MTKEQFIEHYLNYLEELSKQNYSQDIMEISSNMLLVIPKEKITSTISKFTEIAAKGLPERDYHYEISQVFKKIMNY